jgi:K+ transporter
MYIPVMNWLLLVSCLAFVTVFGSINQISKTAMHMVYDMSCK